MSAKIDFNELTRAGIDPTVRLIENELKQCEGLQYSLTPENLCKLAKDIPVQSNNGHAMTKLEKLKYKRQLARVYKFWDKAKQLDDWTVRESNGKRFKVIFERGSL